ncbi:MAG TPA: hypothetical protein DEG88_05035 [Propionibacteriaceae bacterium]|nr:hypothetical protein [Propionibacteriaceae bacterium]HBY22665.1 hypothetical protein [Propionibacteriaceae bacterium]
MTVALIPSLLTQVFILIGTSISTLGWVIILGSFTLAFFLLFAGKEFARRRRLELPTTVDSLDGKDLEKITTLISVLGATAEEEEKDERKISAVQRLIINLPNLTSVHVILAAPGGQSASSPGAPPVDNEKQWLTTLRKWAQSKGHLVSISEVGGIRPSRFAVEEGRIADLERYVRDLPGDGAIVDITSDNKPMGVTMFLVAAAAGLPATVIPSGFPGNPDGRFMLLALTDPNNLFTSHAPNTVKGP